MKTKKGISPLIATVLIIGFTIVLAAMVMQWGGGLFEKMKTDTAIQSEVSIACSSGLTELKITGAKLTGTDLGITVDNSNEQNISGFLVRWYKPNADALSESVNTAVNPYEIKTITIKTADVTDKFNGLKVGEQVGVMPKITVSDGTEHICSNEKKVTVA